MCDIYVYAYIYLNIDVIYTYIHTYGGFPKYGYPKPWLSHWSSICLDDFGYNGYKYNVIYDVSIWFYVIDAYYVCMIYFSAM